MHDADANKRQTVPTPCPECPFRRLQGAASGFSGAGVSGDGRQDRKPAGGLFRDAGEGEGFGVSEGFWR